MVDLSFAEAMAEVEAFHGLMEIPVFEGAALRGVLRCALPEFCEPHKCKLELGMAFNCIYAPDRVSVAMPCGCVFLGHFRRAVAA